MLYAPLMVTMMKSEYPRTKWKNDVMITLTESSIIEQMIRHKNK